MRLPTVWMGVLSLIGTVSVPQNDEKCLHWFGIVWSNIPKYQKGGEWLVFIITHSCLTSIVFII